ncbi:MAG: thioredoxin fold domain-containing protein [Desulfobacteraceae bacterium]|jgi:thioredoxin 1|nr:thioredoxin fold domain-containing protein [Desulfobacteraceae bacterium]
MIRSWRSLLLTGWLTLAVSFFATSCDDGASRGGRAEASRPAQGSKLAQVSDYDHFRSIVQASKGRLVLFEFYADWCGPCRLLEPILEDLAREFDERISVYKVDIDAHRDLARDVGVRGVPYVLLVRDGKSVHSLMGLHPKNEYRGAVEEFSP